MLDDTYVKWCCSDNDSYWPNADIEYRLQSSVDGFAVDSSSGMSVVTKFIIYAYLFTDEMMIVAGQERCFG